MFESIIKRIFSLQTFGEGGGGAAGGDAGAAAGGADTAASEGTSQGGSLEQVKYGRQDDDNTTPEADAPKEKVNEQPARKTSFDELIKNDPDYAKEMQKRIDNAINRRFAKSKAAEEQNSRLMPALNLLSAKYGVEAGNVEALIDAINGDSDLIEQQAMDAGMEPEAYREFQKLKAENEALKKAEQDRQRAEQTNQTLAKWQQQAEVARRFYPNLDLRVEAQNEMFSQLLGSGVDVKTAYEVVHQEEIQQGLIMRAAADAQKETVQKIANKQGRPRENAAGRNQAATVKADISKLTTNDFDEIMRRAARGERIRF